MDNCEKINNFTQVNYLIIYNERSGRGFYNHKKIILNYLKKHKIQCIIHNTTPNGSFSELDPNHYKRIIVAGGDGTLKEVANWMIREKSQTPLGIIPRGSANIVALSLGIPINTTKALKIALHNDYKKIDVGLINKREYFILAAGLGFDARVIKNTSRKMKRIFGIFAYIFGIIKSFLNIRVNKVFVKTDEINKIYKVQSIFISNISEFFNFSINPEAKIDDGYLNVSIFKPVNALDVLKIIGRILTGRHKKSDRYTYFKTKKIYILPFSKNVSMQIDGEIANFPYLDIEVVPLALNIISNK